MVYDLIKDKNGKVIDAIVMQSIHGSSQLYINTKISKSKLGAVNKIGDTKIGNDNNLLYYSSRVNKDFSYGISEGTVNAKKLSDYTVWKEINNKMLNGIEFSILRFVSEDKSGSAVLNYQGEKIYGNITGEKDHNNEIIKLNNIAKDRIKYSHLYIVKTVNKFDNSVVEENSSLKYKIIIKNNSDKKYTDDLIVTENLSKFVTYKKNNYKVSKNIESTNEDLNNNKIQWNIGKLKSGETVEISYTVKVNKNCNGKTIESKGQVANIPSRTVKNKVGKLLSTEQKNEIVKNYNNLKKTNKYTGKELVNEIYKNALGIDLKLKSLNIASNKGLMAFDKSSTDKTYRSLHINTNNSYYKYLLNNYYGCLSSNKLQYKKNSFISYKPKKWKSYKDINRRADTIYAEHFQTGDILIYINKNDVTYKYNEKTKKMTKTKVTYENGEYAFIFIEGKGFVGINYGDDGKKGTEDDRNEFTENYYTKNKLSLFSRNSNSLMSLLGEYANLQTLYGKDYYVILRPSLGMN